jgi:molybdate transport system substrate-binding protein
MAILRATSRESVATRRRHRASILRICVCLGALALSGCNGPVDEPDTLSPTTESAARIKVITSGGFTAAFDILGPLFEQATGIEIETQYGSSMGGGPTSIPVRLAEGEVADVLIFNDRAFDDLAAAGYLQPDTRVDLANSIIGMSVRSGAPKPDISTLEAFVETLRAAESFGYSASVSGTHLSTVALPSLGIWEEIESKSRRVVTERVASVVARGEIELGFQAVSEILAIEGADYVGPIPDEIQQTSSFLAVIPANTENADGAARLIEFLSSPAVAGIVASTGLSPSSNQASDNLPTSASARPLKIITSGGFTAAFDILGPIFAQATGIAITTEYGSSMGGGPESIPVRLAGGETADMVILNRPPLDELTEQGYIRPASRVDLGRSVIGMAVRSGAPIPDISTREAFIETLLAAESIAFSASVSGTRLSTEVFPSLGIWEAIEPRTLRVVGERVASVVARGDAEIGFQQVSAILPVEGADYVGTIPDELQEVAFFSAGIMESAANPSDAESLLAYLSSEAAASIIESTGLTPVVAGSTN